MMEPSDGNMEQLASALEVATYGDAKSREEASQWLVNAASQPGIATLYMNLIARGKLPEHIVYAAVVQFYGLIKNSWNPEEETPYPRLSDADKSSIKQNVLELYLSCSDRRMGKCLCDAIGVVGKDDYVYNWPELLPKLREGMSTEDPMVMRGVLRVVNKLCKVYRGQSIGNEVVMRMLKLLECLAERLREVFVAYTRQVEVVAEKQDELQEVLQEIKVLLDIFYSLNGVDLPKEFSEQMAFWMGEHHKYVTMACPYEALISADGERPGIVVKVKKAAVRNVALYLRKYEDDFEEYIEGFAQDVWKLLEWVETYQEGKKKRGWADELVMASLDYLTRAVQSSRHALFADPATLEGICAKVVIQNISMSQELYELFEADPLAYVEMDMKGADSLTRRHAATDLVVGLRQYYNVQVTEIFLAWIRDMLKEYARDPGDAWPAKDRAIYLFTAIAATSRNYLRGATSASEFVPLLAFFHEHVLPELQDDRYEAVNERPVIKADCLRFVVIFRRQLMPDHCEALFPALARHLTSRHAPVVSYAAMAIDTIITTYDALSKRLILPPERVSPQLEPILLNLFSVGRAEPAANYALTENPHVGAAIAHVILYSRAHLVPYAPRCLTQLTDTLSRIYRNPVHPEYIHYLFEAVASVLKILVLTGNDSMFQSAETHLLPAFLVILGEDITDLAPYVFQIMAQLIEAKRDAPDAILRQYGDYFQQFTSITLWERVGNIPALTRLLVDYIHFVPAFVSDSSRLNTILGIFNRLQKRRGFYDHSFQLLQAIFLYLDHAVWHHHALKIYRLLLDNLKLHHRNLNYVHPFISFIARLFYAKGSSFVLEPIELVQKNLFSDFLVDLLVTSLPTMPYRYFHDISIGMATFLADPLVLSHYEHAWTPLLCAVISMLTACHAARFEDEKLGFQESWTGEFSKLSSSESVLHRPIPLDLDECVYLGSQLDKLASDNKLIASKLQNICSSTEFGPGLQEILGRIRAINCSA